MLVRDQPTTSVLQEPANATLDLITDTRHHQRQMALRTTTDHAHTQQQHISKIIKAIDGRPTIFVDWDGPFNGWMDVCR